MVPHPAQPNRASLYLTTQAELDDFCVEAKKARVLAVDTEFMREKTYYPQLCLVQVAAGSTIAAVDPIAIEDLSPLTALLADEAIVKVFHACSQDLEVLYDALGVVCAPVFDTQIAAAFLGLRTQLGLGQLVEAYTGVHLAKAESLTDWSRRPLDPEQLVYAEDDVRYLGEIYECMCRELTERDRLGWVLPEMAEACSREHVVRDPYRAYERLRRSGSLTRRQLAVAREVCAWREYAAAERDIPRKWLVSDEVLVEVCRRAPANAERLRRVRGTDNLNDQDVAQLVDAVARGLACPAEDCPHADRHSRPAPEAEGVCDLMYAVLRLVSEKSGVAPQLIASKDDLVEFMGNRKRSRLASGWRWELAGEPLSRLLDGELGLTVKNGKIELL